ncbi:YihA family ribosome biogenesis GTP-binding protein [Puteibacter caeruleilacunae]|nr:YihA family ribosome biogenesis GTP-binding protein [Puteibacter caeruleilacunae]
MEVKTAKFIVSNTDYKKCPAPTKPEYAFIGRSNVGKSSLINMLCNQKALAKTSSNPGKTQLINHFDINDEWYLVDLPGYGYAKVSKVQRAKWEKFIRTYLKNRENLYNVFVLIDSRIDPQKIDLEFMEWLGKNGIPFSIVFTKADKLRQNQLSRNIKAYRKKLLETWEELPVQFTTSSETELGKPELLSYIDSINKNS